jgi:XRE family transcriptional regulator, regulator of sulfur utilization
MEDLVLFGKNIRAAREAANMSRDLVAERAGITTNYLGEIERGEKWPSLENIRALARSIRVSPARFFEFENEKANAGTLVERIQLVMENRTSEEQEQAVRVLKALFGL